MDNDTSYDEDDENDEESEEECIVDYGDSSAEIAWKSSDSEVDDQGTEQPEANSTEAMSPDHVCTNTIFYIVYTQMSF